MTSAATVEKSACRIANNTRSVLCGPSPWVTRFLQASQCPVLLIVFLSKQVAQFKQYQFSIGACPTATSTCVKAPCTGTSCFDVKVTTKNVDSRSFAVNEDTPYIMSTGELTLVGSQSTVVLELCMINTACANYLFEAGKDAGKTPRCRDLISNVPSCAVQCNNYFDFLDSTIFCAGGAIEVPNGQAICQKQNSNSVPGNPDSSSFVSCRGSRTAVNAALNGLKYIPPKLFSSGKPAKLFLVFRMTLDAFDPVIYRKDLNVTVYPVNTAPAVSGSLSFRVQEDRPALLAAIANAPVSAVWIFDDAGMQEGNLIAVNLNTVVHGSISIGGSNLFPVCPRCPGQVILVLSSILCKCSSGSPSSMPWYILREGLNLSSSITLMNSSALANLQYVSGANIHDKNDVLHVYVNDNGYADQNKTLRAETDLSQRLSNSRDLTLFIDNENDPPVLILQEFVIVVQGGSAKLEGGHMEDFDYTDYLSSSSTAANTNYSLQVSCDVGVLKMSFAHTSCFVQYKPILNVTKPVIIVNVDARATSASFVANRYGVLMSGQKTCTSSTGLPINDCSRLPYMMFETTPIKDQLISYPSATLTLRIYKVGCIKDSCPIDCVDAGTTGTDKPTCCQQQCVTEGKVSVNIVSCQFTTSLTFDQTKSMDLSFPPIPVGQIYMTNSKESWLEFPLDISLIRAQVASDNGMLCLNLVPDSTINETVFFYSPDRQDGTVNPKQGDGWPFPPNAELILVRGRSYNCTGSGCSLDCSGGDGSNIYSDACQSTKSISRDTAPCVIEVEAGSGIGDANLFFSTDMITMNSLLDDMMFNLSSNFSNAQGTNKANISFALKDELAVYVTVADNGWYQPSELPNYIARTNVTIVSIPIKTDPLPVKMNPVYDEPWLQDRLNNGLLPAYVMLEDCGNRPVEDCENCDAECRTKLQVLPTVQIGESVKGLFTVEISSKLGTITIPKSLRSLLSFSKGSGYRDRIVRFDGYTNDIRNVIQGLVYHTLQDQSIQYKNQYIGKCSRPCFLADIGPPAFLNTKEVAGCEQSCSQYIFNRVNDFNKSINAAMEADSYVFLETLVITFEDNAVTGIGTKGFAQVLLYNFYTLAINDRPCIIFGDTVSDGCRQRCATSNLANKCSPVFNSVRDVVSFAGNPFDLLANITRNYLEDDQTAVRLG
eukprot:768366-Hanusia_phi.AAC.6